VKTNHVLLFDGKPVRLSLRAAGILAYLIQNRNRWVPRQELKTLFWKRVSVEDNSVDQQISDIRCALDANSGGKSYVETRYGSGWMFVAEPVRKARQSIADATDND
jgi:two-component system response regulator RegX3